MPPKRSKDKEKPDISGFLKLKKELSAGKPGQLYIFHGEETYLREYYLDRLREAVLTGGLGEFNRHEINAREMSPHALEEAVDCLPMMAERTLVQVTDFDLFKAADKEAYIRILSSLPEYCCLVFLYDVIDYKPDARTKLAAALKEHGTAVNFARQETSELVNWIRRHFRSMGKDIEPRLCQELIELCGDLMQNLKQEIEKIGAYARGPAITLADIQAVATPQLSAVVFRIADAIGEKRFDEAAGVLGDLYRMQVKPGEIIGAFGGQMRQIYSARLALQQGRDANYVARLWGMRYPANRLMNSARRFSLSWCRRAVIRCAQTHAAMRSDSGQTPEELMTTLLLELTNTA
ncbi:DNA polymerase III subunit delta [Oscillospiraceae bacterium 44-5]|jgi:DNA polymerase-3 subunit delta|uniref:DNA polymerase III subunit delta n=1 Tax=Lawsonibacter sp. JLR.KK007 TaxID=3114293 RepID=UPI002FEFF2D8